MPVAPEILPFPSPGEILIEELLKLMGFTIRQLAREIGVREMLLIKIIRGKRSISPDVGLRLSRRFGLNDGFWIGLQADHDLHRKRIAHWKVSGVGHT